MRVRVVGAGVMGRGIAQWAAVGGHTVELVDARTESVGEACEFVAGMLERAGAKGRMSAPEAEAARGRLVPLESPYAVGETAPELVVEAVREDLETKAEVFTGLEKVLPAGTLFATNTSSLSVTEIGARLTDPGRLAGLHFFNPVPLMRIVEVVPGADTRRELPCVLAEFVEGCGHRAVTVADTPGFLVNHAGRGLVTEALALLEENTAGVASIDRIARDVLGLRMGPFELMDLTGLDVTASVTDTVWRGFRHSDRLRPSSLTANRVTAGLHGRKTGRGWYAYDADGRQQVPAEPALTGDVGRAVTVAGDGPDAERLRHVLRAEGAQLDPRGSADALVLVPVWGGTVAAAVAAEGLPAERTVGVDLLSVETEPGTGRRVLAVTPAASGDVRRDAAAVLARGGAAVTVVRDTAGSVAQRLLASVVSVGASIAERGIATPEAIDLAVTAGLGYPYGPLAWGQQAGAERMLTLQQNLYATTGDPRYSPTRWVTERARLGLPLTAPMPDLI